jgi:hypothetical protein
MNSPRVRYLALVSVLFLLLGGMLACDFGGGGGPSQPTIVVTAPTSGTEYQVGDEVNVLSSASDAKGVMRVELYVDGVLYRTDPSPIPSGSKDLTMVQQWIAEGPGTHTLSVTAVNVDGQESAPWAVTIRVAGDAPGPSASPTMDQTSPPTVTVTVDAPPPTATVPPPPATATVPPPTPTSTVNPNAPIIKFFQANGEDETYVAAPGERVTLIWDWERVDAGYLDPGNVALACPTVPCTFVVVPEGTTTYTLKAINSSATVEESVTVKIE